MNKEVLINKAVANLQQLPDWRIEEVNDYIEFLLTRVDDQIITKGIEKMASSSKSYDFLKNEPDIYSVNDLKEKYK